jgi:hypothetical protein
MVLERAIGLGNLSWAAQRFIEDFDKVVNFETSLILNNWSSD